MADKDQVKFGYESPRNVSFQGKDDSGYTKAQWREMSEDERNQALQDYLNELVDVYVDED